MMSWLKKIGLIAARLTSAVPPVRNLTVRDTLSRLIHSAQQVEIIGEALGLQGEHKHTALTPLVAQAILECSELEGRKIKNDALFKKAMDGFAQATADLLNSYDDAEADKP